MFFADGILSENYLESMDETYFVGTRDVEIVDYAYVAGGADGSTMVLRLRGGTNTKLEAPFIIFKNRDSNYPMMNLLDNIEGISYRTQTRDWMDNNVFQKWLQEARSISKDPDGKSRTLFLDNCSGHMLSDPVKEALNNISASLKFLTKNATHLCQPLDSFIIQKLRGYWRET